MFRQIQDFIDTYSHSAAENLQNLQRLTDASLSVSAAEGHRNLGGLGWHIVQSIPGMANEVGLGVDDAVLKQDAPAAAEIAAAYKRLTDELCEKIRTQWTDETLLREDNMYGETWKRGFTLLALYAHEVHHFGQLTELMRLAGLPVHGVFGPSREEWAQYGMEQPAGA
jgi:uncharacterized damage-inducible protein DinB